MKTNIEMDELAKLPDPDMEQEAHKMASQCASEMARQDARCSIQDIMGLLESPERLAEFTDNLFSLAILTRLLTHDRSRALDKPVFALLISLCRFVVARKHKMIRNLAEHHEIKTNNSRN